MGSTHDIEGTACVDCHDLHIENDPVLALDTQTVVCYQCHQEQRAQFLRQSRHPVATGTEMTSHVGLMACSDCHQPHGSSGPGNLIRSTLNETCYECHAEKRGPFLWEHQPVREDCSNCHTPHGSNYESLLTGRGPWLCQQCHSAWNHPSTDYSGTGIPPQGAAPEVLAGQCLNCHNQVHGSNHPSGLRMTR
jgi:DmsE family decaheme c-type cytochrome